MRYTLHRGDCLDYLRTLPTGSVDAVIADPPYNVMPAHAQWDRPIAWDDLHAEIRRVCKGFYAVFCMMPLLLTIGQSCERLHMAFLEHVVWVKRNATPGGNADKLKRGHESILVYGVHGRHPFYTTRGPFEDVKIPGILFDVMTIDTLQRHYSDLRLAARRGVGSIRKGRGEMSAAYTRFRTDANLPAIASGRDVNYTNVWSFLPPSLAQRNRDRLHPTQKPIEIMKRLAEMTTPAGGVVLDPFMGSGTTGVACVQTGRNFVGCELDAGFFAIAEQRIEGAAAHLGLFPGEGD